MKEKQQAHAEIEKRLERSEAALFITVNDAPIGPGNENDENDEEGRQKRKQQGGGKGESNSF